MSMRRIDTSAVQEFETRHASVMRKLAPECMVLLGNDGTLPLQRTGRIALYGNGARNTIKGGTGSGDVNVRHFTTVEEGLTNAGFEVTTKNWLDAYERLAAEASERFQKRLEEEAQTLGIDPAFYAMGQVRPEPEYDLPLDGEGDTALYILARNSGECVDRKPTGSDIHLSDTEIRDILALHEKYSHFILVLNVGGMVDLTPVKAVENVLLLSQLGTATGDALADVLLGKSYPSGKLAMTWAPIDTYPSTEGFGHPDDTPYREGIYVGYRYFDKADVEPVYPFGYGIGYTEFMIGDGKVSVEENRVTVTVKVTNIGKAPGKEVVQVYYSAPEGKLDKPLQELAAYAKTGELAGGESEEIKISFSAESMASYDEQTASYLLEKGIYYIRVGNCSRNTHICGAVMAEEEIVVEKLKNLGGNPGFADMRIGGSGFTYPEENTEKETAQTSAFSLKKCDTREAVYRQEPTPFTNRGECSWREVTEGRRPLEDFVAALDDAQLAYLCIGDHKESLKDTDEVMDVIGDASGTVAGAAGETTARLSDLGVGSVVMADGPAGLRLSTAYSLEGGVANAVDQEAKETGQKEDGKAAKVYYQYCTAIPIGTALAQSWNDESGRVCGDIAGEEMELFGTPVWLAPAMNIQRSPLCGRNFEYYSEDPLISGHVASAITAGVQAHEGCITTIKHFACNNQETNRYFSNSLVSERALREIYLKGFEICVKTSQPGAVMTSYNLINGEHACNRRDLVTSILRDEWGYEGIVMTDWLVTGGVDLGRGKHPYASAAGCVKAGNDITMPGMPSDKEEIERALSDPEHPYALDRAELESCAARVLGLLLRLKKHT